MNKAGTIGSAGGLSSSLRLLQPYPPTQENKLVNSEEEWENHLEGTRQNYSVTSGEGGD